MKKIEVEEMNNVLLQIRNILIVIACILLVGVIVIAIKGNSTSSYNNNGNQSNEQEDIEYDVSMFTEVSVDEMFNEVNKNGYQIVYIGRSTCGYCKLFLPALQKAQDEFKYKTLYIDLTKVTEDGYNKMKNVSDDVSENFGATPMVIVYKDGQYKDMFLGYAEYSEFESFLSKIGMTK